MVQKKTKFNSYTQNEGDIYNFIATYQGMLYSLHKNENSTASDEVGLYKISNDGSNVIKLTNKYDRFINSINNWMYFHDGYGSYRMMTDGTNLQQLN